MFVSVTDPVTPPNSPESDQNNSVPDNSLHTTDFPVFYGLIPTNPSLPRRTDNTVYACINSAIRPNLDTTSYSYPIFLWGLESDYLIQTLRNEQNLYPVCIRMCISNSHQWQCTIQSKL